VNRKDEPFVCVWIFICNLSENSVLEEMEECPEVQSDGCQHLISFLAERGTEPFQVIYRHFVACNSPASRKRKVLCKSKKCVSCCSMMLYSALSDVVVTDGFNE